MAKTREQWLEEQKKHRDAERQIADELRKLDEAEAGQAYEKILQLINQSGEYFSLAQRNQIVRTVKPDADSNSSKKSVGGGNVQPKYQLDTGETWAGRGKTSAALTKWAESAEGKKWRKDNPGEKFPLYPNPKAPK